jgi:hypothetical protein
MHAEIYIKVLKQMLASLTVLEPITELFPRLLHTIAATCSPSTPFNRSLPDAKVAQMVIVRVVNIKLNATVA